MELLHECVTKATTSEGQDIRRSLSWVVSRRAQLQLTDEALVCGDWTIPYKEIDDALLFTTRTLLKRAYVLRVKTGQRVYQFGLNYRPFWESDLPFPVRREAGSLGYSWFSIAVRLVFLFLIGRLLWRMYSSS